MVKVITIMDDVYEDLTKLKKARGLSFSGILRHLIIESGKSRKNILSFAGSVNEDDINKKNIEDLKKRYVDGTGLS